MYEGSQQSLSDMAARQAQAVDRLGRLRTGLIAAVKRRFPRAVLDAEAGLGRRLREVDDEVLLAQLDALLHSATTRPAARDADLLERVRLAVERLGMGLPGGEAAQWVAALEQLASGGFEIVGPGLAPQGGAPAAARPTDVGTPLGGGLADLFDPAPSSADPLLEGSGSDELAGLFGDGPSAPAEAGSGDDAAGRQADAEAQTASGPRAAASGAPDRPSLRPEVTPAGRGSGRRARAVRTKAAPPERLPLPLPDTANADTAATPPAADETPTAATSQALLAAACIPRPVFAADLVAVAGSMEAVRAWERQCREENLPVRIVPAKMRHAGRGALIFPVDEARALTTEFRRSLWGDVLAARGPSYRGARLYEFAVLLHRVGEQVVSHRLGEHTATLRLAQPGGLTGVVVAFSSDMSDGSPVRAEMLDQVGQLVGERLAGVAVLTTSGEAGTLEALVEVLSGEARARSWQPTMPVVAARSWEYADSRGTSATLVLGG